MEVDSRPPPPPSGPRHDQPYDHHHHHQPLQQVEANRQSLPPPSLRSPPAPLPLHALSQKSPSNPPLPSPSPAVKPVHEPQYAQPPLKQANAGLASRPRELPPMMSHSQSPGEQHRTNGQSYPRSPQEIQLSAIERLQTQISQNSSALVAQSRDMRHYEEALQHQEESLRRELQTQLHHQNVDIRRVEEAVGRLQHEVRGIRELLEALTRETHATREMQARGVSVAPGQPVSAQDSALELMAQQVAVISQKANEVDTLKITIEIMKNKIQRLEDAAAAAVPTPQLSAHPYASPREPSAHSAQSSHGVPSYHTTSSVVPHINTPVHPAHKPQSFHSHATQSIAATPEASQRTEAAQTQSGWVTVNAGTKRTHPNGLDSPHDSVGQPVGSPKRPKLAPIEPRVAYPSSQAHPPHVYDHMDTDDSDGRAQTHSHTLPSQTHPSASIPESTLASQYSHTAFVPYGTQEGPSDDSWRPESQRIGEVRTRGRGRGGGPGSRGGRGRKSMPAQVHHISTPEWERDDWQGVPDSQISPDGYYNHVARSGRGIIRRGSGGGGTSRGDRPSSSGGRAVSLGLQGVTAGIGIGLPADPYAHTKKTRTKPIRNADGVLIRKDGRPDMRSQSSAANLRKVHARKEEEKGPGRGFTPTNPQYATSVGPETPSPTGHLPAGQDIMASVQKRHSDIMGKMFPGGLDEARREHDYARKVFDEDQDHTAHPRAQHHHHHQTDAHARPLEIKREQIEARLADTQSPNNVEVGMDRPEDHADDESQTPGSQSDNSGQDSQYHDASNQGEQQALQRPPEAVTQAPKSTVESSQTLAESSAQAS